MLVRIAGTAIAAKGAMPARNGFETRPRHEIVHAQNAVEPDDHDDDAREKRGYCGAVDAETQDEDEYRIEGRIHDRAPKRHVHGTASIAHGAQDCRGRHAEGDEGQRRD